jgi:1D-myo-inositol-tetrakisphosphate 5-kinase/inositol-polyphosphate multikinase
MRLDETSRLVWTGIQFVGADGSSVPGFWYFPRLIYRCLSSQIRYENDLLRKWILRTAVRRATKWISYQISGANHMVGQIGGISAHKRPLLTLNPDYVLKPLQVDHRGIREIAFYEAVKVAAQLADSQAYDCGTFGSKRNSSCVDVLAFSLALWLQDPYVVECERRIMRSWRAVRNEAKLLCRLHNFIPNYFGVVKHETPLPPSLPEEKRTGPYGISFDSYLLLQDATVNFSKPCVIDVKIGSQSYEPDATEEKRTREQRKYPVQSEFGFRIVGMRIYDPSHPEACDNGFVFYSKEFGRSLATREDVKSAFVTYYGAGTAEGPNSIVRSRSICTILSHLRSIQHWFNDNDSICFYASSLLIAYEGNTENGANPDMVNVKMIDFGRVRRQAGGDPGYLLGLEMIIQLLEEILLESKIQGKYSYGGRLKKLKMKERPETELTD